MIDPAADSTPVPRRFRRRVVVLGALLLLLIGGWWSAARSSVAARARAIQVGQPREEVIRLMGQPQITYMAGPRVAGERYSDKTSFEMAVRVLIYQYLGFASLPHMDTYPVDIQYDANRRVERIRIKDSNSDEYVEN